MRWKPTPYSSSTLHFTNPSEGGEARQADGDLRPDGKLFSSHDPDSALGYVERARSINVAIVPNPGSAVEVDPRHSGLRPGARHPEERKSVNRLVEGDRDDATIARLHRAAERFSLLQLDRHARA